VQYYHRSLKELVWGRHQCKDCQKGKNLYNSSKNKYDTCKKCGVPVEINEPICPNCKGKPKIDKKSVMKKRFRNLIDTNIVDNKLELEVTEHKLDECTIDGNLLKFDVDEIVEEQNEEVIVEPPIPVKPAPTVQASKTSVKYKPDKNLRFQEIEDSPVHTCACGSEFKSYKFGRVVVKRLCQLCVINKRNFRVKEVSKSKVKPEKINLNFKDKFELYETIKQKAVQGNRTIEQQVWFILENYIHINNQRD
jgi:hypothetical protein